MCRHGWGLLLENFIATSGNRASRTTLLALAKTSSQEKRTCAPAEATELVAAERVGVFCVILVLLGNRGRGVNRQLFFFTLIAQARCLSRTGMELFNTASAVGVRCREVQAEVHVVWLDNFSKFYATAATRQPELTQVNTNFFFTRT